MNKTYLLTGGTGFLGSLLAVELLKRGDRIIFLGRSHKDNNIGDRIKNKLKEAGYELSGLEVIEADIRKDNLGISEEIINNLIDKIDGIWHLAANLSFRKKDKENVFSTNVLGLRNILTFIERLKCPIYYVSTAYVHGRRTGIIYEEELIRPKAFNNPYEESKFLSEQILREWGKYYNDNFVIFRPSILIEREGRVLSFFGYYSIVLSLYKLKKKLLSFYKSNRLLATALGIKADNGRLKIKLPFLYSKRTALNLIPVDLTVDWMIKISQNPASKGKVFHIVNPNPFPMEEITKQTFKALDINAPIIGASMRMTFLYLTLISVLGQFFNATKSFSRRLQLYRYYLVRHNVYDMKNTKEIVGEDLSNFFHFEQDFIERLARDFIRRVENNKLS